MKRKYSAIVIAAGVAVLAAGTALVSGTAHGHGHSGNDLPAAPASLRVPAGNKPVAVLHVLQGAQVYTCTGGTWRLTQPAADLGADRQPTVLHTAGPEWVSTVDGSAVWGAPLQSVTETGAVPDLLVKAVKNRGTGLFGHVDFIQRLDTSGGLAPTGSCADRALAATPYHATYVFWAPADSRS
jgi:hypothetical protein